MKTKKKKRYLFLGLFFSVGVIVGITEANILMIIVYLFLAILFFNLWKKSETPVTTSTELNNTDASIENEPVSQLDTNIQSQSIDTSEIKDILPKEDVSKDDMPKKNISSKVSKPSSSNIITKKYNLAGTSYKQESIENLGDENYEYDLSKKELSEIYDYNQRIYKYNFFISNVVLEPEPTNPYDPEAIKVIADNVHIGYIKKGKCKEVKNLLNSGKELSIDIEIYGGPYKALYVDYDYDKDKNIYSLEKDTSNFNAKVSITYKKQK